MRSRLLRTIGIGIVFFGAIFLLDRVIHALNRVYPFDCPIYWPLSVFNFRAPAHWDFFYAAVAVLIAIVAWKWCRARHFGFLPVLAAGIAIVLSSNLIQDVEHGFWWPVDGGRRHKVQYYHDALKIDDVSVWLARFNADQDSLFLHSKTHPPGAVLIFHGLRRVFGNHPIPICLSIALATLTLLGAGGWSLRRTLGDDPPRAGYFTLLLFALPATQIYGCMSIDALIAALLLCAAASHIRPARPIAIAATALCLIAAASLTYAWIVAAPLLLLWDWRRKTLWRSAIPLAAVAIALIVVRFTTHFDYVAALRFASHSENPFGPRFLWQPWVYAMTRLEDIAEIALYLSPWVLLRWIRGVRPGKTNPDRRLITLTVPLTTLALFLLGSYHTGETARACNFLYPFLLSAAITDLDDADRPWLYGAAIAQSLLMQLFGRYFW